MSEDHLSAALINELVMELKPPRGHEKLPSGPSGRLRPTMALVRDPRSALTGWATKYGDPFFFNALNGPVVVTGRPDLIRTIYGGDPNQYEPFAVGTIAPLIGSGSMLILTGEPHKRERRLVMPLFHGDRMRAYGEAMQQVAIEQFNRYAANKVIDTLEMMTSISLEIIVRAVFGGTEKVLADKLIKASRDLITNGSPILFFTRRAHVSFLGFSPWDRWNRAKRFLFDLLDQIVAQRSQDSSAHEDILSMLLNSKYESGESISREHLYAELLTFLLAGHETSALAMTWAIEHLHRNPDQLAQLQSELDTLPQATPTALAAQPFLKAVVQESLRMHPIITETLRKLVVPMQLGDYLIPAGIAVAPATVLAHYNPETYPDPDKFRPARFIERSYSPFEFMPFGGGHRRCIGAAFASYEMAIVLGTILSNHRLELIDSEPPVAKRRGIALGPSTKVPVRVLQ